MRKINTTITRYASGEWYIDIVESRDTYEAWLQHRRFGVSELMFGMPKEQQTRDEFMECVSAVLPDYKASYRENIR